MKKLLFILLVCCSLSGFGQSGKTKITRKNFIEQATFGALDTTVGYHSNKAVKYILIKYSFSIEINGKYYKNRMHFESKIFRADGTKVNEVFTDTAFVSIQRYFDKNGKLKQEYIYEIEKNGLDIINLNFKGINTKYPSSCSYNKYEDGYLIEKGHYLKSRKNGAWEYYDKLSGKMIKKVTYKNGKKIKK